MESRHFGILIDVWDPKRGGAEQSLARLAAELLRRGHRGSVFAGEVRGPGGSCGIGLELRPVAVKGWTRTARNLRLAAALPRAARAAGCDVTVGMRHLEEVDVLWSHGGCHVASVMARRAAKDQRSLPGEVDPNALRQEELRLRGRHRAYARLERGLLEGGARQLIAVSDRAAREWTAWVPEASRHLEVVRNGVDLQRFHPRLRKRAREAWRGRVGSDDGEPLLVFCAREPSLKGLGVLASAWERAAELRGQLIVAGVRRPGPWPRRWSRIGDRVRVHWVGEADTAELFAAADLLVHPTYRDTSGLVIQEALAVGTPVITTRNAGESVALGSAACGRVLDSAGDVPGLAEALDDFAKAYATGRLPSSDAVRAGAWLVEESASIATVADLIEST